MVMEVEYMLTTRDNPFNPFTQYNSWLSWDERAGYYTPGALARVVLLSDELSEADLRSAINAAIDQMVNEDVVGIYKKVTRESFVTS